MYECTEEELITDWVAVWMPKPIWMNADGYHIEEGDSFGCKVTLDIIKPEMFVVADEVDGNTLQKDDGKMRGEKWVTKPGNIIVKSD